MLCAEMLTRQHPKPATGGQPHVVKKFRRP
jgi:hypothetical protein